MNTKQKIQRNVKKAVADSGKISRDICEEMAISESTLKKWKQGKNTPPLDELARLSEVTGISMAQLTRGVGDGIYRKCLGKYRDGSLAKTSEIVFLSGRPKYIEKYLKYEAELLEQVIDFDTEWVADFRKENVGYLLKEVKEENSLNNCSLAGESGVMIATIQDIGIFLKNEEMMEDLLEIIGKAEGWIFLIGCTSKDLEIVKEKYSGIYGKAMIRRVGLAAV